MPPITDPNVLVGISTADDAAVYKISEELAVVLTVDFFTPVVDDPYDFGRIAVTNALSDIYAMGGKPVIALNLVSYPTRSLPLNILDKIIKGGVDQAEKAGISIAGGHSIDDPEPKYGLVVMGFVHPDKVMANSSAKENDLLYLTKPIGTGIIATGIKEGIASNETVRRAVDVMTTLNKDASEAALRAGVNACTDVTGFGLLGHLYEMVCASGVGAVVHNDAVPIIEGTNELLAQDTIPGGTRRNLAYLEECEAITWNPNLSEEQRLLLCDAQTAGGLLISVSQDRASDLEKELISCGALAERIGKIIQSPVGKIHVE